MISTLAALLALSLVLFAGHGILRRLRFQCAQGPGWYGWALLCGCTALAAFAAILSPMGIAHPILLAVLLACTGFFLRQPHVSGLNGGWLDFSPILLIGLACCWQAFQTPLWNPDALFRWAMHAKWLANSYTLIPEFAQHSDWSFSHPTYPPLLPSLGGLVIGLGGDPHTCLRLISPSFFIALLGIVFSFCHKYCGRHNGNLLSLCLALTPVLSWLTKSPNSSGIETVGLGAAAFLADIPLALALTAAATLILEAQLDQKDNHQKWCLSIACMAAVLTKQEGFPSIVAVLAVALALLPGRLWLWRPTLFSVLAFVVWKLITLNMPHATGENYLSAEGLQAVTDGIKRLPLITDAVIVEMIQVERWGGLWAAATVLAVCTFIGMIFTPKRGWMNTLVCLGWMEMGILIACLGFLSTGWHDGNVAQLIEVSLTRLLVHIAPCGILALACALHATRPQTRL